MGNKIVKIKKGDLVKVVLGKDKGREGKVEAVYKKKNAVLVPTLNLYKRHLKGGQGQKSGIYEVPRPINVSKIMLICPNCKKITRVGFKIEKKEKFRVCRKCNKRI